MVTEALRRTSALAASAAALAIAFATAPAPRAQEASQEMPDVAALEAQLEEMFQTVVAMPEEEPMYMLQAWGAVFNSATVLEQVRAISAGRDGASRAEHRAATERLLARWEERRPDSAGPHLVRTFEIEDPVVKRDAILAIADRYPDDALALSQATQALRETGDAAGAAALVEAYVARNPRRAIGYRLLAQSSGDNETRRAAVLERWAAAIPGDPELVSIWLDSPLASQEPEATGRVVATFFDRQATDAASLTACLRILRQGDPTWEGRGRACLARIAADPGQPDHVTERATTAIAERAAADGDWSSFLATLDALEPASRVRAVIATARNLAAPTRCTDIVDLLSIAAQTLAGGEHDSWSLISAARGCSDRPDARALFLDLVRRAPADRVGSVIGGWATKVNGRWQGELPPETGSVLEARLDTVGDSADADGLFAALDIVYQLEEAWDRRSELLIRWQAAPGSRFDGDRAIDLAIALVERDRGGEAVAVLESQLARRFEEDTAAALWELYLETEGEERATRFAGELIAAPDEWRRTLGHVLAARGALEDGDLEAAERHYWSALESEQPRRDVAVELLAVLGWTDEDGSRAEATAARLCRDTALRQWTDGTESCAADLLARAGRHDLATEALLASGADLPDDLPGLRQVASTARNAGRPEIAEAALRKILELDPRSEGSWIGLGSFLEKEGRAEEVAALLERSRELFDPPPSLLARAAGRALTAGGDPERAIDLLLAARGTLPDHPGGEWSRGWIDHELGEAYRALGQKLVAVASPPEIPRPELDLPRAAGPACAGGVAALERSAADGDPAAAAYLGRVLLYGHGDCVAGDGDRGRPWLEAAADAGRTGADYDLGLALLVLGDPEEAASGLGLLEQAAGRPGYLAPETLAFLHGAGVAGVPRDVDRSRRWTAEAARRGSDGFPGLRESARRSPTMRELVDRGLARLEALAAEGDAPAAALLARLDSMGLASEAVDPGRTIALARSAAEAGEAGAMRVLMHAYATGAGVDADETARRSWRQRCAAAGDSFCRMFLGHAFLSGDDGVERDVARGIELLRRAAEAGNWWATADLGRIYDRGDHGLPRDPEQAARWKRQLADQGDAEARGWLHYHGDR